MNIFLRIGTGIFDNAIRLGIIRPEVVTLIDGGICSQMHQYILGRIFKEKGYDVCYDLSWFSEHGADMDNKFIRNFDLPKAFPYLDIPVASRFKTTAYRRKHYHTGNNTYSRVDDWSFLDKKPPIYLGGYYHLKAETELPAFRSAFHMDDSVLDETNRKTIHEIRQQECPVAIHVRRGDIVTNDLWAYGTPASTGYFRESIDYIKSRTANPHFWFFSDEPEWVAGSLIPALDLAPDSISLVSGNGSDKGYMDLFLIAACRHQITSKGTLGKYGALLGGDGADRIVTLCDDTTEHPWKDFFANPVFI